MDSKEIAEKIDRVWRTPFRVNAQPLMDEVVAEFDRLKGEVEIQTLAADNLARVCCMELRPKAEALDRIRFLVYCDCDNAKRRGYLIEEFQALDSQAKSTAIEEEPTAFANIYTYAVERLREIHLEVLCYYPSATLVEAILKEFQLRDD